MDSNIKQPRLITFYAATGHLMMHMFAAFYFVIVLAIEDDWNFSYDELINLCLLYTSPSPRDRTRSRMPSSA